MTNLSKELCKICGIEPKTIAFEIYPDFTQPDNFVKLLELKIKTKKREATLCEILHLEYGFVNVLDFLKYLKSHLAGTIYFSGSYIFSNREQIIQVIRETEWVYE